MSALPVVPVWKYTPFLRITPPFLLGVVFAPYLPCTKELSLMLLSLPAIYLSVTYHNSSSYHFRYGVLNGVMINLALLAAGLFCVGQQDIRRHPDWLGNQYISGDIVVVQIQEPLRQSEKSYFTKAKVSGLIRYDRSVAAKGWILLTFPKQLATVPEWGDILLIVQPVEALHQSGNPGAYDRNTVALRRQIYHQAYLNQKAFRILFREGPPLLVNWVFRSREKLLQCLQQHIPGKKEAGLAEALLVGYKQDLDPETVADYTSTGIVHVIAISGVHLGIIYLLLHALLHTLPGRGWGKGIKALLVLMGIWGFSLLAGNGPSVLRSAIMYSSLIIGGTMKRNNDSLNALFASAFLLICIEPEMVYDAGFQLSYLAVLGLLLFHQRIRKLWITPHQWIDHCWNLISLSLAAQLFTFPVSLFHFHQFPTYFLPANLIAVPFTSILLVGVIILLCLSAFAPVAAVLGKVLFYAIYSLNQSIHFFASLPWGTWQPLHITLLQCILLYIVLLLAYVHPRSGSRKNFRAVGALVFLIILLRIRSFYQAYVQKQLIIYDIPKSSRGEWHLGRTAYYWNLDTISDMPSTNRILNACRQQHRIQKVIRSSYDGAFPFVNISSFRILHLNRNVNMDGAPNTKPVDLLLLSGQAQVNVARVAQTFLIRQVVIDRSVSRYLARRWTTAFIKEGIPCHNIVDKGAFVMKLP